MSMLIGNRAYLRPIILLALNTGMRRGEILNMEWRQVDFSSNRLVVTKTKSGKPRHIPMNQIVRETLLELHDWKKGKYIFESGKKPRTPVSEPKKAFNSAIKDAEIEDFRFHDLRHTAGTRLAEAERARLIKVFLANRKKRRRSDLTAETAGRIQAAINDLLVRSPVGPSRAN